MRGTLKQDVAVTLWNSTFTVPKGAAMILVKGASGTKGDLWAVESEKLLIDLTGNSHDSKHRYCFIEADFITPNVKSVVIWSKFGLHRNARRSELTGIVDADLTTIDAEIADHGYCLTWCDVEPVALLAVYPEDKEPDEVLAWVNQKSKPDGSHEFLFDVEMRAAIRVHAKSKEAAIALIAGIDANEANLGAWPNGAPIICEISSGESTLVEIDGEAV